MKVDNMESEGIPRSRLTTKLLVNLATQKRHLRHLTCIFGRNIDPHILPPVKLGCKPGLLNLFFTLHTEDEKIDLYQSEQIEHSLNPSWNEFDTGVFPESANCSSSNFVVKIWASRGCKPKVIIKLNVNLSGLIFFGDQLKPRGRVYEANTLIFKMFGQYYSYSSKQTTESHAGGPKDPMIKVLLKVEQDAVSWAYKKFSLQRVHTMLKAVHETKQQVTQARSLIERNQQIKGQRLRKRTEKEFLSRKINLLKEELKNLKEKLEVESNNTVQRRQHLEIIEKDLNSRQFDLEQYVANMKIRHSAHIGNRETLVKVNAQLTYRRKQLAAELSYIFPVVEIPQKEYGKKAYAVTGVRLPISDALAGEDDEMLSVALGNTSHLVAMMAKLILLPLRYPIKPMGSRSSILDLVKDRLTDKEREFPLYLKGREKYQFHYGVFLLNKDIAQLRYHCGLGTSDLRQTLFNLKHLFENKFGVRIIIRPDTETLQQRISQVPLDRTLSEANESDTSPSVERTRRETESSFERPRSFHDDKIDIFENIHKSKSSGDINNRGSNKLPAPPNRTQMHKLINRKSKKMTKRASSMPDPESPRSADLLLEVPFEDMLKGNAATVRRNTIQGGDDVDFAPHKNGVHTDGITMDKRGEQGNIYPRNEAVSKRGKHIELNEIKKQEYGATVCLECLRSGRKCIDCIHRKQSPVSVEDVNFGDGELTGARPFNRQYSDILLIPGPFDDHDQIAAIDESSVGNTL